MEKPSSRATGPPRKKGLEWPRCKLDFSPSARIRVLICSSEGDYWPASVSLAGVTTMTSGPFLPETGWPSQTRGGYTAESDRVRSAHRAVNPAGHLLCAGHTETGRATKNQRGPTCEGNRQAGEEEKPRHIADSRATHRKRRCYHWLGV